MFSMKLLTDNSTMLKSIKYWTKILYFLVFAAIGCSYFLIERLHTEHFVIHCNIDDFIPFLPIFIIPYILWYIYVPAPLIFEFLTCKKTFPEHIMTFFIGAVPCLICLAVFPSCVDFRPSGQGSGILYWLCRLIFDNDGPVNVFPSLHCYEAVIVHLLAFAGGPFKDRKILRTISAVIVILICLSTVFVKQHSIIDSVVGVIWAYVVFIVYKFVYKRGKTE